jgi:hypothetical protein
MTWIKEVTKRTKLEDVLLYTNLVDDDAEEEDDHVDEDSADDNELTMLLIVCFVLLDLSYSRMPSPLAVAMLVVTCTHIR